MLAIFKKRHPAPLAGCRYLLAVFQNAVQALVGLVQLLLGRDEGAQIFVRHFGQKLWTRHLNPQLFIILHGIEPCKELFDEQLPFWGDIHVDLRYTGGLERRLRT